ncbi:AbrB/MazE/SpoVT family DNA-binding domain-containing protein [Desulfurivibrio alkaliphilus]|uniref:Transcriptional regulator, AbrB family n=1 Tax=Desulfurivibrio alkaliphilus (strain DSM 19089 / UNIQEM U267 / AHT2) TaxID=589865 RepID=D6Z147_DESAT|nr:AbrB/MazE/SpoVT family DNA-binding domain-containing protein [Desulfurivibrio alkaliphilus]ADH87307.1 transcriptional regulator, AbrB family [Desulfurivibrio alkaliphilus AHT 2]
MPSASRISSKGQVVIPAELRKKHHLEPGTPIRVVEYGEIICLVPMNVDPVAEAYGSLPPEPSLADELGPERRRDFRGSRDSTDA